MTQINPVARPSQRSTKMMVVLGMIVVGLLALLGFFHIVQSADGVMFVAKEHFSYAMTFTSIEDILRRNNSSFHTDPLLQHLVQELEQRGKIGRPSSVSDPATEREVARIWKQAQDQGVELAPYAKELVLKYYPDSVREPHPDGKVRDSSPTSDQTTERELARNWKQMQDQGVELAPYAKELVLKYYPEKQ